jgi:hypothetical protein
MAHIDASMLATNVMSTDLPAAPRLSTGTELQPCAYIFQPLFS